MKIPRKFTQTGQDVFDSIQWKKRTSRIVNPDGSVVFEMTDAEVPADWSQLATDIMVSKYFRKAGVPQIDDDGQPLRDDHGQPLLGPERSVRQVVGRLAGCWTQWGHENGYFDTDEDAQAFHDEISHMLLHQMVAPNSPQWFNTGLFSAYGINGPAQGHYYTDPKTGETRPSEDAYTHPQPHACFIQSVEDSLVNPGGIMDLWVREARLFKYGSGTGTNFSRLRAEDESLSGGGKSSGLMSFLRIGDRAAGAIKSGGTTRRAAKMVCLDLDHPDAEAFINWKSREELKVAALVEGLKRLIPEQRQAADQLGLDLDYDFNGEAYQTVSGQNANNSVRIPNSFFKALDENSYWEMTNRIDGSVAKRVPARELWDQISNAAWRCADPGVQYDSIINQWHTCPESGRINASNPCSEYMFLDDTACNLASLNLLKFYDPRTRQYDVEAYEHGIHLWTIVLEISVLMAQYPSKEIARLSFEYRTLGLGYANLGAMLMQAGIAYDSALGRAIGGSLAAIMTGRSYATSAEMAGRLGPFPGYFKNREHMLRVVRNHRRAAYGVPRDADLGQSHEIGDYESLEIKPVPIDADLMLDPPAEFGGMANQIDILDAARHAWDDALREGEKHGYRNAQVTVIAPTGTIGLLMDCDTTGVEPDFALVKFKKLAGGGYFKIANQSLRPALEALDYNADQVRDIMRHVMGALSLDVPLPEPDGAPAADGDPTFAQFLRDAGFNDEDLGAISDAMGGAMELDFIFNPGTISAETLERLDLDPDQDMLTALGFTDPQIRTLNTIICGTGTVEGAPHLAEHHLAVFDCANKCGRTGQRFIATEGHIRMMAAVQPFITGAISKTINLPNQATLDDIKSAYRLSWELGLKANALYRDGSKLSQPLNATADDDVEDEEAVEAGKGEVAAEVVDAANRIAHAATDTNTKPVEKIVERIVERPMRRRMPNTAASMRHKFSVAGHEGYLHVGLYDDGRAGELFITMAKEGSTIGGLMDSLGTAISVALQYGVPIESLVHKFTHQRFEPAGMTDNPDIPFAKSLVDYIFRWLGMEFIPGYRDANAPERPNKKSEPKSDPKSDPKPEPKAEQPPAAKPAAPQGTPAQARMDSGPTDRLGASHGSAAPMASSSPETNASKPPAPDIPKAIVKPSDDATPDSVDDAPDIADRHPVHNSPMAKMQDKAGDVVGIADRQNAAAAAVVTSMSKANSRMMVDAPACDVCGSITVRSGTCYKCLNCGNSLGCS